VERFVLRENMKVEQLKEDTIVKNWLSGSKQSTRKTYLLAMKGFTEWVGKTPKELLEEAEADIKSGKLMRERSVKKYLIGFREYLESEKLAPLTVKGRMVGVSSFFTSYDIELPKLPKSTRRARPLQEHREIPTKENLQEVLGHCDELEKAILLVGVASGLSVNEIVELKVKDFYNGYDVTTGITTLKLRRAKVDYDFITFLTPEASKAILDYLSFRNREIKITHPRRENQLQKQRTLNEKGYLFICRKVPAEYSKTGDEELRKLGNKAIIAIYERLSESSQENSEFGVWNKVRSHNIRKYFNSALLNAGADSFFVNYLMGHTLDATQDAYYHASPEKLKAQYKKFVPYLTLQKELDIAESPEYQKLKADYQIVATETARHIVERKELQELRAEMEKMKETRAIMETIKNEYMQYADLEKILEMKNELQRELDEISKLKEKMLQAEK
jgi:integrase